MIEHTATNNQYPGYDIASFNADGSPRYIEVKSGLGKKSAHFISQNEWAAAVRHGDNYWLYVITNLYGKRVAITRIQNPARLHEEGAVALEIERYVMYV